MLMVGMGIREGALLRRLPSNSSSELGAKRAFGMGSLGAIV